MDYNRLAELLYPNVDKDINYYFEKYPSRIRLKDTVVTRFAPSPTGYLHIGGLFQCLFHEMMTKDSPNSVFYMRLEDTDQKREIDEAGKLLYDTILKFDVEPSEGYRGDKPEKGVYGPYKQSERLEIYSTFAKYLVSKGRAYPCFCTKLEDKEDIVAKREQDIQENNNTIDHDCCRELTIEEIEDNINLGRPFALRLKSMGDPNKSIEFNDVIKGKRQIRENGKDMVLIKSNGVPVYAFAHVVDDTLMGTTVVVRGEDWYQSVAGHLEIFDAFGFEHIPYLHTPNICKSDEGRKRKLSKRKDPEADCRYFLSDGYPIVAVKEYLLNLLNSTFEEWKRENPYSDYREFPFSVKNVGTGNPMFDMLKLSDVSKDYISRLSAKDVYSQLLDWAKEYDIEFANILQKDEEYATRVMNIDREVAKPRKDIFKWSMIKDYYDYMFKDYASLNVNLNGKSKLDNATLCKMLHTYIILFEENLDKQVWFDRVKKLAENNNYCVDNKEYKANPDSYNGNVADFCNLIRFAFTGKSNTPDLFSICCTLGKEELYNRLNVIKRNLNV